MLNLLIPSITVHYHQRLQIPVIITPEENLVSIDYNDSEIGE